MDIGKKRRILDIPEPLPAKRVFDPEAVPQRQPERAPVPVKKEEEKVPVGV